MPLEASPTTHISTLQIEEANNKAHPNKRIKVTLEVTD